MGIKYATGMALLCALYFLLCYLGTGSEKKSMRGHVNSFLRAIPMFAVSAILAAGILSILPFGLGGKTTETLTDGTNTDPAAYTGIEWKNRLKRSYPNVYNALADDGNLNAYVIPGLKKAKSIIADSKKNETGTCTAMDPQGLALTERYLLISAYDRSKTFDSVLFVLDRKTGDYIKTVVLPGKPHAGGITFDPGQDRVWLTISSKNQKAGIAAIDIRSITEYNLDTDKKPISYDYTFELEEIPAASCITYFNKSLYVGYFRKNNKADLERYPLTDKGFPNLPYNNGNQIQESGSTHISYSSLERIQGVAVTADELILSQSYGTRKSELIYFSLPDAATDFDDDDITARTVLPPYLEQIVTDKDDMYLLFESAASKYMKNPALYHADRVLRLNRSKIAKDAQ